MPASGRPGPANVAEHSGSAQPEGAGRATLTVPAAAGLWSHQIGALEFVQRLWKSGRRGALLAMAMGCVAGDAEIIVNRGGAARRMPLRELYRKFHGPWNPGIPSRTRSLINGELHLNHILDVIHQGTHPVLKINLASGKWIRVTPEHEIAMPNLAWCRAGLLRPGIEILVNGQPACRLCGVSHSRGARYPGLSKACCPLALSTTGITICRNCDSPNRVVRGPNARLHLPTTCARRLGRLCCGAGGPISHRGAHSRLSAANVCFIPRIDTVVSVVPDGESDVYDLQMADAGHNFVANGIIVHNCGKSRVAIELALHLDARPVLILCPLRVVDVWRQQYARFAPGRYEFVALDDRVGSVADKRRLAQQMIDWAGERDKPLVICINYDSARRTPFADWALNRTWPLTILDECVPLGTRISTPTGDKPVEALVPGDIVLGYDHATGQITKTPVIHTFRGANTGPRYLIGATIMTSGHPVWTQSRGYIPVSRLREGDYVIYLDHDQKLRLVRLAAGPSQNSPRPVLEPGVLDTVVATGQASAQNELRIPERPCEDARYRAQAASQPRAATNAMPCSRVGRVRARNDSAAKNVRPSGACRDRNIRNEYHPGYNRVYNIETGSQNYFANGLLVHNSHKIKDPGGRMSRFCARLGMMSHYRLGLTGTPMAHSPLDLWGQFRFLDARHLDPTYGAFRARYAVMGGYYGKQVVGWQNLEELRERFRQLAFQVDDSVLDLPEEINQTLFCELDEEGARIYREMERNLIAELESGAVITAANALSRLLRLAQITGGSLPDESGDMHVVDRAKEELLQDTLEDLREPVVVFARFRADLEAIHRAARAAKVLSRELSGSRDDLAEWKKLEEPAVLAVQIQAGGVGIDLSKARVAIYYSHGYSLADYLQSRARIHRPPQNRACLFLHLCARHSIDEHVMRAIEARRNLIDSVLSELQKGPTHG